MNDIDREYAEEFVDGLKDDLYAWTNVEYDELDDAVIKALELALEVAKERKAR